MSRALLRKATCTLPVSLLQGARAALLASSSSLVMTCSSKPVSCQSTSSTTFRSFANQARRSKPKRPNSNNGKGGKKKSNFRSAGGNNSFPRSNNHKTTNKKGASKKEIPQGKVHPAGPAKTNFVPPALLLPTASRFAYVARAAFSSLNDDEEETDPRELARTIFADVVESATADIIGNSYVEPFAGASFEYFPPRAFDHELPTNDNKGNAIPEVAFLGRSNVGKSSLINSLMKRDLARCSKHPGRTQLPYYYGLIPNDYGTTTAHATKKGSDVDIKPNASHGFLVDLPGYGYASAPKKAVEHWQQDTQDFLTNRRDAGSLHRLFLLIDARRGLSRDGNATALDLSVMRWMDEEEIPYTVVITKSDCVSAPQLVKVANEGCMRYQQQHQEEMEQVMHDGVPEDEVEPGGWMGPVVHITSAKKGEGLQELRSAVEAELSSLD